MTSPEENLDEYASLLSRIQTLESELAESREQARRYEWARDTLLERCQALTERVRQLQSDGDELVPISVGE
jgi:predicted nuclease with TOPRIM domain